MDSRVSTICLESVSSSRWRSRRWHSLGLKGVSVVEGSFTKPKGWVMADVIMETETSRSLSRDMASQRRLLIIERIRQVRTARDNELPGLG